MSTIGSFFGLNIGSSALSAVQNEENVAGNNIANDGTAGYSEETANLVQGIPLPIAGGLSGDPRSASLEQAFRSLQSLRVRDQFHGRKTISNANSQENTDQ